MKADFEEPFLLSMGLGQTAHPREFQNQVSPPGGWRVIEAGPAEADFTPADLIGGDGYSQGGGVFQRTSAFTPGARGGPVKAVAAELGQNTALSQAAGAGFLGPGRQLQAKFRARLRPENGQTVDDVQVLFPSPIPGIGLDGLAGGRAALATGPVFSHGGFQEFFIGGLSLDELFHIGPA